MTNKHAKALGKLGGNQTKKRGKAYYSKIGKQGAKKRWGLCGCCDKPALPENIVCKDCL